MAKAPMLAISLLFAFDLVILFDIPFLRQIAGFIFLLFIPGLLILYLFNFDKIGITERIVLSVGLSVSFLMIFGLLISYLSTSLGYYTPFSTKFLLFALNVFVIGFVLFAHKTGRNFGFPCIPRDMTRNDKIFLIIPALFPALSVFGMYVMNTSGNNQILLMLLILIPIYIIIMIPNRNFDTRFYPIVLFLIGISVILMTSLRSSHIIGTDAHNEFFFFKTTYDNLHWGILKRSTLDSTLSISILPTIYKSITNIADELLFKVLFSIIFSFSPLVVYLISNQFIEKKYSFIAGFFLIAQYGFKVTPLWARVNIAIFFFALFIFVLSNDNIVLVKKRILYIIFSISIIISHYATSYIFCLVLFTTFIIQNILLKFNRNGQHTFRSDLSGTGIVMIFSILYIWYAEVIDIVFTSGVNFIVNIFRSMADLFIVESRSGTVGKALGMGVSNIPNKLEFIFSWVTILFITIGVLKIIYISYYTILKQSKCNQLGSTLKMFNTEYIILSLVCFSILVVSVIYPHISVGYGMERVYFQMSIVLSFLFIIGGMEIGNKIKINPHLVLLFILLPVFLSTMGVTYQLSGYPREITLNSDGPQYDNWYLYDGDIYGAQWLKEKATTKVVINSDETGKLALIEQFSAYYPFKILANNTDTSGYLYLRNNQVFNNTLYESTGANKIYDNDLVESWRL
ncbi:DUF2206 domain-containing protein [Methanococcoides sp. SA1]|nr:DUF2206 domain-containing protein [Methanococcoides sp. SA1]